MLPRHGSRFVRLALCIGFAALASCSNATLSGAGGVASPTDLSYALNPAEYLLGEAIPPDVPTTQGGPAAAYSVSPALPSGLVLEPATGVLSGTPTAVLDTTTYTVTAANSAGATTTGLVLAIRSARVAPSGLRYATNPAVFVVGKAITPDVPSSSGGPVSSYAVTPALPSGLRLNTSTGVITGTPTAASAAATYTVTARNAAGSTTVGLTITVQAAPAPPTNLTYTANPATYTVGTAISPNSPRSSGGAVTSYSVTPSLPAGLSLGTSTGVITGTPTTASAAATYTVTARNAAGSTAVVLTITVNPASSGTSGCGIARAGGSFTMTAVDGTGATRTYVVDIPVGYLATAQYPVIFGFHGAGSTGSGYRGGSGFLNVPGMVAGAILVWPDGSLISGYESYGTGWDPSASCGGKDLAFFDAMLAYLENEYCVNGDRVFVHGFSWGADFTNALACCRPAILRAITPASGDEVLTWNPSCGTVGTRFPAVRLTYGTSDTGYTQAQFQDAMGVYKSNLGCATTYTSAADDAGSQYPGTCKTYDGCAKPVVECSYPNMGHQAPSDWPAATWSFISQLQ